MKMASLLAAAVLALSAPLAQATVSFSFADDAGDHTGLVDVTLMTVDIDELTGDYSIDITADAASPFTGAFRVNVNLFNVTRNEYFQDVFNDLDLGATTQTLFTLTGNDALLVDWQATDTVATSTLDGLGNPPGTSFFRTSVSDLPFRSVCVAEDVIGASGCAPAAGVPEPDALLLLALGLAGLAAYGLKRVG